jgi:8-oxo-dGTP pyrophosphatase MutT (NUDIX family)
MPWAEDYHASVFIKGPDEQTVLITDTRRPPPQLWKFPGGKMEPGEDPFETALREAKEETGLSLQRENLTLIETTNLSNHTKYFFVAVTDSFEGFQNRSKDGEIAGIFDIEYLHKMVDIHPRYYEVFLKAVAA